MKRLFFTFLTLLLFGINCSAQKTNIPNIKKVYLDNTDTTKNFYTIIYPPKLPWTGYIFLVAGFGETAEKVLQQTDLPKKLALNGILTIIPTFQDGVLSFGVDSLSQQSFGRILKDVTTRHKLIDQPFYLGGYSIGGSCILKYAEESDIKPNAVFAIDPPIDFEQMYNSSKRNLRLSVNTESNGESVFLLKKIKEIMNGTPENAIANYKKISPYSFSDTSQTAIKKLLKVPLRIYTEPDIHWWMKERGMDYTSMNSTLHSAMINELNRHGNRNAKLIITLNKGYRKSDNNRHPHSWSIVDNDELIKWLQKLR